MEHSACNGVFKVVILVNTLVNCVYVSVAVAANFLSLKSMISASNKILISLNPKREAR